MLVAWTFIGTMADDPCIINLVLFIFSEQELEIMSHLEKKLQYTEEEKHRLECRLRNTELELKETQTSLEQSISKRKVSRCYIFYICLLISYYWDWNDQ